MIEHPATGFHVASVHSIRVSAMFSLKRRLACAGLSAKDTNYKN